MRSKKLFSIFKLILLNSLLTIALLEITLQIIAYIWVEPEKVAARFVGQDDRIRVLTLGDSHTYGLYLDHKDAWPMQFQDIWNASQSPKVSVLNFAYPGTNTVRLAKEIDNILEVTKPDLVLLMIGGNDFWTAPLPSSESNTYKLYTNKIYLLISHLKIYKLFDLLRKQTIYNDTPHSAEMDLLKNIYTLPEQEAKQQIQSLLEFKGISVACDKTSCYAKNGEKSISIDEIYTKLLSTKNTEFKLYDDLTFKDPQYLGVVKLYTILSDDLGFKDAKPPTDNGSSLSYGGHTFILGSHSGNQVVENVAERLIDNMGKINNSINEHGATALLLNYHRNYPINRDIQNVSLRHHIAIIDINSAINKVCNPGKCPELLFPDGHPKKTGQHLIAEEVKQYLITHPLCTLLPKHPACLR